MVDEDVPTVAGSRGDAIAAGRGEPVPADMDDRYELGGVLGRGGMGEVRFAYDQRIDREVAIKLLRTDARDEVTVARFYREAQIQGRLDHPAVVPVHDMGIDRLGNPYFVMKRLTGTTLLEVLSHRNDPVMREKWPRRQLLARFIDVCLAVEYAHNNDVVHRDLKPANVMLGDYGEAYVLDWGLARVISAGRRSQPIAPLPLETGAIGTAVGAVLGTPGYMAPEQIRSPAVDGRADVYSLGCILYEILTAQPALPRGLDAIEPTLEAKGHRPSDRFPELGVAPELDEICARATAAERTSRPTARAMATAVQAYLDGDRDLERRRDLARDHAIKAQEAFAEGNDRARARAMREAGRALVLDPNSVDAQGVLAHLLLEAPNMVPDEAIYEADAERGLARQAALQWIWKGFAALVVLTSSLFVFPVRNPWPLVALIALTAACGGFVWAVSRRPLPMHSPYFVFGLWINAVTIAAAGFTFGPFLIVPLYLVGSLAALLSLPTAYRWYTAVVPQVTGIAIPLVCETIGLTPATFHIDSHGLLLTPWAIVLTPDLGLAMLLAAIGTQAFLSSALALTHRRAQTEAQNRLHAHSWHLRQLLPRRQTDRRGVDTGPEAAITTRKQK